MKPYYAVLGTFGLILCSCAQVFAGVEGEGEGEAGAAIVYVRKASTAPAPDGLSWASAFPRLQDGIDACEDLGGGEVWVASGSYGELRPAGGAVVMKQGVRLYGGFAGSETARDERDWTANLTVIDGLRANNNTPAAPVVRGADDAVLDGFRIQNGRALSGGGMVNDGVSPRIEHCVFTGNRATEFGAGMWNINGAAPVIVNSVFYNNRANIHGGGIQNDSSSPTIVGCTIAENFAEFRGGGIYNNTASFTTIVNCIVYNNSNENIGNTGTSNPSITYSCLSEIEPGVGNIFENPLFRNASIGNFRLLPNSPCIDQGRDTAGGALGAVFTDFRGSLRGYDGDNLGFSTADGSDYDMGAFEFTGDDDVVIHRGDYNENLAIDLSEVLRIVQFYNSGGYRCVFGTEDGYAPGLGTCETGIGPHDADFDPQDFRINLEELLRVIQFYNAPGGYVADPESEDGFRPIFLPV